jgi:hypothetical protein
MLIVLVAGQRVKQERPMCIPVVGTPEDDGDDGCRADGGFHDSEHAGSSSRRSRSVRTDHTHLFSLDWLRGRG